jgi:translation initiation factor IF-1
MVSKYDGKVVRAYGDGTFLVETSRPRRLVHAQRGPKLEKFGIEVSVGDEIVVSFLRSNLSEGRIVYVKRKEAA